MRKVLSIRRTTVWNEEHHLWLMASPKTVGSRPEGASAERASGQRYGKKHTLKRTPHVRIPETKTYLARLSKNLRISRRSLISPAVLELTFRIVPERKGEADFARQPAFRLWRPVGPLTSVPLPCTTMDTQAEETHFFHFSYFFIEKGRRGENESHGHAQLSAFPLLHSQESPCLAPDGAWQ